MKYYAIRKGRTTGIVTSWPECQQSVSGFPGAQYKSFKTKLEAETYLAKDNGEAVNRNFTEEELEAMKDSEDTLTIFVDGSYDEDQNQYAFGMVAIGLGEIYETCCADFFPVLLPMRNVAGEIVGAMEAMDYCIEKGVKKLELYYDYAGIEAWATGDWKCEKEGTKGYKRYYDGIKDKLEVRFHKVPAHNKIKYNERADELAKSALGL